MASRQENEDNPPYQSDEHILCDDCDKLYKGHCPEHGPLEWIKTTFVVDSDHYTSSMATLPDGLVPKESGIPDNHMGVFAARLFYRRTMFGPFKGIKIPSTGIPEHKDLTYSWDILHNGLVSFVLDGTDEKQSNWMRYVTYARDKREQNLIAFQYQGEIFYRTFRDVYPGEELMIWYEDEYSCSLDELQQEFPQDQVPEFACQRCRLVFAGATYLYKHQKFRCPDGPLAGTYGARTTGLVGALFRLPVAIANDSWSSPVQSNNEPKPRSDEVHHSRRKRKPRKLPRPSDTEDTWNPEQPFGPPPVAELNDSETTLNQNKTTMVMLPPEAQALAAHQDVVINSDNIESVDSTFESYLKRLSSEGIISDHQEKRPRLESEVSVDVDDSKHSYLCNACGKSFSRPVWWAKHESRCRKKNEAKYKTSGSLTTSSSIKTSSSSFNQGDKAIQVKPKKEPYKCGYCEKRFACPSWMRRHERVHTKKLKTKSIAKAKVKPANYSQTITQPYTCVDCGRDFAVAAWLTRHRATNHPNSKTQGAKPQLLQRSHVCRDCGRGFAVAAWLTRHRLAAHKKNFAKKHVCGVCGRAFAVAFWLTRHRKTHEEPGQKNEIDMVTTAKPINGQRHIKKDNASNVVALPNHVQTTAEPPFACQHVNCEKIYSTKRMLIRHKQKHVESTESKVVKVEPGDDSSECHICGKEFSTSDLLIRHIKRIHRKTFLNTANIENKANLEVKSVVKSVNKSHVCKYCNKTFSYPLLLQRHLKRHRKNEKVRKNLSKALNLSQEPIPPGTPKQSFVCKVCNASFKGLHLLNKHMEKHLGEERKDEKSTRTTKPDPRHPFKCDQCERTFAAVFWLTRHKNQHKKEEEEAATKMHKSVNPKHPFQCDECGRSFAVAFWLTRHKREHENSSITKEVPEIKPVPVERGTSKVYVCDICDKEFIWPSWLVKHRQVHKKFTDIKKEERPIKKPIKKVKTLKKASVSYEGVKASKCFELFDENGVKQYRCTICGKTTVWHTGIVYHIRVHHTHEKPFKCRVCGKDFHMAGDLTKHARRHSGEKPYYCQHCKKRFATSKQAKKHAVIHSTELPFHCKHCGKRYRDRSSVWRHLAKKPCPESRNPAPTNLKIRPEKELSSRPSVESSALREISALKKKHEEGTKLPIQPRTQQRIPVQPVKQIQNGKKGGTKKIVTDKRLTYVCKNCNRSFCQLDAFNAHIESYTKAGRIVCEFCGKCWARTADLTRHLRVHTGERPYLCPDCGLGFKVSDALKRHMGKLHPKSTKPIIRIVGGSSKTKINKNDFHGNMKLKKKSKNAMDVSEKVWSTSGERKFTQVRDVSRTNSTQPVQGNSERYLSGVCSKTLGRRKRVQAKQAVNFMISKSAELVEEHNEKGSSNDGSNGGKDVQLKETSSHILNDAKLEGTAEGLISISVEYLKDDSKYPVEINTSEDRKVAQVDRTDESLVHTLDTHDEGIPNEPSVGRLASQAKEQLPCDESQTKNNTLENTNIVKKEKDDQPEKRLSVTKRKRPGKHSGGTKARRCEFCGKVFSAIGNLARHVRLHTGERPFNCKECGQSFMRTDILSQHISKFHPKVGPV